MSSIPKKNVMVFCGGPSTEHEISLISAHGIIKGLKSLGHTVHCVGITRDSRWRYYSPTESFINETLDPRTVLLQKGQECQWIPHSNGGLHVQGSVLRPDVCFPIVHSHWGEDGKIQTLCEMADLPFVGVGLDGATVSLNKDFTKRLLRDAGLPIVPFQTFYQHEPRVDADRKLRWCEKNLHWPVFVKPATQGSSVGVVRVEDTNRLAVEVESALKLDRMVVVEQGVSGRELEVSVLGVKDLIVSEPGEIIVKGDAFYTYDAKYIHPEKVEAVIKAKISTELSGAIREVAGRAFRYLNCEGLARIDFFLERDEKTFYINEINTLPGFTPISMYPKMLEGLGLTYEQILSKLLDAAIDAWNQRNLRLHSILAWKPG